MTIIRYTASADTTITNAYEAGLVTRGTGSNMGYADSLEVFSIYGQESGSAGQSQELSRILIQFPIDTIKANRTANKIPASGNVSFYLKMFNAETPWTLPQDFNLVVAPVSASWSEGAGLDMDNYQDLGESNWIARASAAVAATATITITDYTELNTDDKVNLIATDGTNYDFKAGSQSSVNGTFEATTSNDVTATNLMNVINTSSGPAGTRFTATVLGAVVTVTQAVLVGDGNTTVTITETGGSGMSKTNFSGGASHTPWTSEGGDYHTGSNYNISFPQGYEDLEHDVSHIVEEWIKYLDTPAGDGVIKSNGFGVRLTASQEAYALAAGANGTIQNLDGAKQSYYTKKFFARSTEYFFKRPVLEARWNGRTTDDRENFFYSSSLAPAADNLNTLVFYNYIRGRLVNIPAAGAGSLLVSFYSSSNGLPTGSKLALPIGGDVVAALDLNATASYTSAGLYSVSLALTAAATPAPAIHDVWHLDGVQFFTGSFYPELVPTYDSAPTFDRITSCKNLKKSYSPQDTARFRFFVRSKNWSPTLYTVATANNPTDIITSASFSVARVTDNYTAIPYGTGSDYSTYLSYDKEGNYFDLDMGLLESGYMYEIKLSYYNDSIGAWQEQSQAFKFRVEE